MNNMKRLFRIELRKIIHNRIFWITFGGYVVTLLMILMGMQRQLTNINENLSEGSAKFIPMLPTEIYSFPHVWHNLTYIASFLMIFLAVVMVILVTNEYAYNTMRQNLINGMSRVELVLSKFVDAVMLSFFATVFVFIFGLVAGFTSTNNLVFADIFSKMPYLGAYFLMVLGFLTFAMMLAFLIKKPALVLGTLLLYNYIVEPLTAWKFNETFGNYLPLKSLNFLVEIPDIALFSFFGAGPKYHGIQFTFVFLGILYTAVFFGIAYYSIKRKDL